MAPNEAVMSDRQPRLDAPTLTESQMERSTQQESDFSKNASQQECRSGSSSPLSESRRSRKVAGRRSPSSPSSSKPSPTLERFLERQAGDRKTQIRRHFCKVHRDLVVQADKESNAGNWGRHGADGFRKKLALHSGSVAAAWRTVLDPEDAGSISFGRLCVKLQEIGFGGHIRTLFNELDTDRDGFITLADIDPEAAAALLDFRVAVMDNFGSTLQWWKATVPRAGTKRLSVAEFTQGCQALGILEPTQVDFLFRCLRVGAGHKYLTLAEIDPQAAFALKRADPCAEGIAAGMGRSAPCIAPDVGPSSVVKHLQATLGDRTGALPSQSAASADCAPNEEDKTDGASVAQPQDPSKEQPQDHSKQQPQEQQQQHDTQQDQLSPNAKPNTALPARRSPMAKSTSEGHLASTMPLSGKDHSQGASTATRTTRWVREISMVQRANMASHNEWFMGKLKGTKDLAGVRSLFLSKYGSMYDAWRVGLRFPDEKGKLGFVEFCEAVRGQGYVGSLPALFSELDPLATGFVTLKDLDPHAHHILTSYKDLLRARYGNLAKAWVEAILKTTEKSYAQSSVDEAAFVSHVKDVGWTGGEARELFRTLQREPRGKFLYLRDFDLGAFKALCRDDPEMITEEKVTKDPNMLTFNDRQENCFRQRWSQHQSKQHREEMKDIAQAEREADLAAGDVETLLSRLVSRYGTVALGWKNALDPECHGRLSWTTFADAMRRIGLRGDFKKLFEELDVDCRGYLTLENFAPEVAREIDQFRRQLVERYGNLIDGWRLGLDTGRVGRLDEPEFTKRCEELGLAGDVKVIFTNLQAWNGRKFVTLTDLDQKHIEAYYREDFGALTVRHPHGYGEGPWSPNGTKALNSSLSSPSLGGQTSPAGFGRDRAASLGSCGSSPASPANVKEGFVPNLKGATLPLGIVMSSSPVARRRAMTSPSGTLTGARQRPRMLGDDLLLPMPRERAQSSESSAKSPGTSPSNTLRQDATGNLQQTLKLDPATVDFNASTKSTTTQDHGTINMTTMSSFGGGQEVDKKTHAAMWSRELGSKFRTKLAKVQQEEKSMTMSCQTYEQLRRALLRRYGSMTTAWRVSLDADGNGRLSFHEFATVMREECFAGNVKELFVSLVGDEAGHVTLQMLCPDSWKMLLEVRNLMLQKFDGIEEAWYKGLADTDAWIEEPVLAAKLKELGFDPGPKYVHQLFKSLVSERGKRYLYKDDLVALLIGLTASQRRKAWFGAKRAAVSLPRKEMTNKALESFSVLLTRKFGCVYAGWFRGVDLADTGRQSVPVKEFVLQANAIGFAGNMTSLLEVMGKSETDSISLADIEPEVAARVEKFKGLVLGKYGGFKAAWANGLDGGTGLVDEKHFRTFCADLGYNAQDARELFQTFLPSTLEVFDNFGMKVDRTCLYFEDFGPLGFAAAQMSASMRRDFVSECALPSAADRLPRHIFTRPDPLGNASPSPTPTTAQSCPVTPLSSQPASPQSQAARNPVFYDDKPRKRRPRHSVMGEQVRMENLERARLVQEERDRDLGPKDAPSLRKAMITKFGSLYSGWRNGLDLDGNGRVGFQEFCDACRRIAFAGDVRLCFKELDKDKNNMITFDEFAPEEDAAIRSFRELVLEKYGTFEEAWDYLDTNHNKWLEEDELAAACADLGYAGSPHKLFKMMKAGHGIHHITYTDLDPGVRM
eukprot:TRINITY_DN24135_c1_g1_i1.p1 TRINITY_DN24135_c1_g1~~TRINITY_DN24135_c1_g1_i1.p1  ORF type:complete len:1699 (-),score=352.43 TRINITY_DN24135_c1_g1_i1:192-5237(-)